jgi:hypothetical protein
MTNPWHNLLLNTHIRSSIPLRTAVVGRLIVTSARKAVAGSSGGAAGLAAGLAAVYAGLMGVDLSMGELLGLVSIG